MRRIGGQCGSLMSQSLIYLGQMGINGAGEGQGRNFMTATQIKQSNMEGGVLWSGGASHYMVLAVSITLRGSWML
jgi:hypothetical protein